MKKSLFRQIFLAFLAVIVFSLSVVGLATYWQSSRALDEQVERYISQLIEYATLQTEQYFKKYELATDSLLSEDKVKQFLEMNPDDSYRLYEFTRDITKEIFHKIFIAHPGIHVIMVIGDHGKAIVDDNQNMLFYPVFDPQKTLEYLNARVPPDGKIAIFKTEGVHQETITIARRIRGFRSYQPKGVLAMEIKAELFESLWNTADLGSEAYFMIVDKNGNMVHQSENTDLDDASRRAVVERVLNSRDTTFVDESVPGDPRMFVSRESDYLGWRMVISLPVDELREPVSMIRTTVLMVGLLTLAAALLIAYRFGQSLIRPIRSLMEGMKETEKGIWNKIEDQGREDEIGGLIHRYNLMVSRLSEMIERVYAAELKQRKSQLELQKIRYERQNAEFQALQLQINPHFLYNTLETINCYAVVQDSEEISEIVEAMAFMLRYSLQTHLEEITLVNELNHVRNYLIIMKHRLDREFEIDVAIPPEYLLHKMVRLTLQPLIENAFQHAFRNGLETHHTIRIDARMLDTCFLVTVKDNGLGMPNERLEQLRRQLDEPAVTTMDQEEKNETNFSRGGIGIRNVHRRIQMVYGEEYGLTIDSEEGRGTLVMIRLPRMQEPKKNTSR